MAVRKRTKPSSRSVRDLLSWRLHALAALCSAIASLHVEREFDLGLLEWRALAQLGGFAPLSLKDLAKRAGLDKSYASRTVAGLVSRGLVRSDRNDTDARGVMLSLTPAGQAVYERAFAAAIVRNDKLLEPLTARQRQQLMRVLDLLTVRAREVFDLDRQAAVGGSGATKPTRGDKARAGSQSDELVEIRYLVSKLTELVGNR